MDVLIVIDMQNASFTQLDKYDLNGVIERINQLSEKVRGKGGKIVFIKHDGTEEEGLLPFTPGWEILSSLTKRDTDIVVRKTTNDAFCHTDLNRHLQALEAEKLIFCGWATDFCVDTSIRSAVNRGYNVVVAADCHTLSDRPHLSAEKIIEHHNWVWRNLIAPGRAVKVLPAQDIH